MVANSLTRMTALTSGADIWILPDFEGSQWLARLDWYLNFVTARSLDHTLKPLPPEMERIIKDQGWGRPQLHLDEDPPLLIASSSRLPNLKTMIVPFTGDLSLWLKKVLKLSKSLKHDRVRIFLPKGSKIEKATDLVEDSEGTFVVELVLDEDR